MADAMELARALREVRRRKYERKLARVAQRTEHRATDAGTAASIPAAGARFLRHVELTRAKPMPHGRAENITSLPVPEPERIP